MNIDWQKMQEQKGARLSMSEKCQPNIVVLYCNRSVGSAADVAAAPGLVKDCLVRLVAMPCSSKVEVPHILKLLAEGADGVLILACPEGGCQFLVGSARAEKRVRYTQSLLQAAGLAEKRVGIVREKRFSAETIAQQIEHHLRAEPK